MDRCPFFARTEAGRAQSCRGTEVESEIKLPPHRSAYWGKKLNWFLGKEEDIWHPILHPFWETELYFFCWKCRYTLYFPSFWAFVLFCFFSGQLLIKECPLWMLLSSLVSSNGKLLWTLSQDGDNKHLQVIILFIGAGGSSVYTVSANNFMLCVLYSH